MYIEKQSFQTRLILWVKCLCWLCITTQSLLLFASESGFIKLPFNIYILVVSMITEGVVLYVLAQIGFRLQIDKTGIDLRFWQYPIQTHHIHWFDIKRLRLLPADELPEDKYWGIPNRDATHIYLLTDRRYKVLSIELLRGTQLFVSVCQSDELLDFLQHSPQIVVFK
jgi:hypothetical protein